MPAKYRAIQTCFWNDSWVIELTPEQKLFFLYLITNQRVSQCGVYEISKRIIEFETGFSQDKIEKFLELFETKEKIKFNTLTSELCIPNFSKYNYSKSPLVRKHIIDELNLVKDKSLIQYLYGIDTIYKEDVDHKDTSGQEKQPEKQPEEKLQQQTQQQTITSIEDLGSMILEYFGFSKVENNEKSEEIADFFNVLSQNNKIESLKVQFESYKTYKADSREKIHGFKAFLGRKSENYLDGGWCAENWCYKLERINESRNMHSPENNQPKIKDHANYEL